MRNAEPSLARIRLLGSFEVAARGAVATFTTRKSRLLFAYLVLARGRILAREALATAFWPDLPDVQARRALHTTLWRVRLALETVSLPADEFMHSAADGIGFRADAPHWVDVAAVEDAARHAASSSPESADEQALAALEEASALYRGDLLADVFEEWCVVQRESFRAAQLRILEFALHARMARGEWRAALAWGHKLLELDGMQEHVHRALMQCHCAMGNRPAAIHQYHACAEVLKRELGVSPMEVTRQAYQAILTRTPSGTAAAEPPAPPFGVSIREELDRALASLDAARARVAGAAAKLQR